MICYRGLIVDIIRNLWDRDLYRDNKWLKLCHDNWFNYWLDYRTSLTMADVDRQIEDMIEEPTIPDPVYWEEIEGETPLGGPLGFRYDFLDDTTGGSDPVQGPE